MAAPTSDLLLNAFIRFYPVPGTEKWLADKARPTALLEALLGSPLFAGIAIGRTGSRDYAPVTAAKAVKLVATGKDVAARFFDREDEHTLMLDLDLRATVCEVRATASGPALAERGAHALDDLVTALQGCIAAVRGVLGIGDGSIIADSLAGAFAYPRPRPPRPSLRYPDGSVVTFLDPGFHQSESRFARPTEVAALLTPPPPPPAQVTEADGVVTVRWARTIDLGELRAGAAAHAAWIAERLQPDLERGFNELGDRREDRGFASPRPGGLTMYDPNSRTGYKAVLVLPDGSFEPEAWDEAAAIAKARQLPDGTPVARVRLVVPFRHHVFEVADQARAAGFDRVLYSDEQGNFWDPDPPGEWTSPPVRTEPPKGTKS